MTLQLSQTKTKTEELAWNASEPSVTTELQLTLQNSGIDKPKPTVQISKTAFHIRDYYGETDRISFRFWSDAGEISDAVVAFVAATYDGLSSTNETVRQDARELLDRILGAAGNA